MPDFIAGDVITDGLIVGRVVTLGSIPFGRKRLDGYRVRVLTGRERGGESFIVRADARKTDFLVQ